MLASIRAKAEPVCDLWVPANAGAVRFARRRARSDLVDAGYPREGLADVDLVLGEMVANAVDHGCSGLGRARLRVAADGPHLLVAVSDPSPRPPEISEADPEQESGRGMFLVAAVADTWGVIAHRFRAGKTVWALCTVPTPGHTIR
ncbi:ATP-binding protein [Streptomyces sp. NPDC092296]|uniref:ATP-binding protein n=1 Tax=Streptomyces sp. NPDC092296 TaxID=3366012 RepID=UPI0038007046